MSWLQEAAPVDVDALHLQSATLIAQRARGARDAAGNWQAACEDLGRAYCAWLDRWVIT
jgi:hypothetical protein